MSPEAAKALLPVPQSQDSAGFQELVATIAKIRAQRDKLQTSERDLVTALQFDPRGADRFRALLVQFVPRGWRKLIAPRPLEILEHGLRADYNNLATDLAEMAELARERIRRHSELTDLVAKAKSGAVPLSHIAALIRETQVTQAGLTRIPLVEELMADVLSQLPPEVATQRDQKTLESLETVLATTEPVVKVAEQAIVVGVLTLENLAQAHFVVTEVRPAVEATRGVTMDITDATVHTIQTPALLAVQVQQAIAGLNLAVGAMELSRQLYNRTEEKGGLQLMKNLKGQADELSEKVVSLLAPPKELPHAPAS